MFGRLRCPRSYRRAPVATATYGGVQVPALVPTTEALWVSERVQLYLARRDYAKRTATSALNTTGAQVVEARPPEDHFEMSWVFAALDPVRSLILHPTTRESNLASSVPGPGPTREKLRRGTKVWFGFLSARPRGPLPQGTDAGPLTTRAPLRDERVRELPKHP